MQIVVQNTHIFVYQLHRLFGSAVTNVLRHIIAECCLQFCKSV